MDGTELVETVRESLQTELSRLGSSKSLYADTAGEMEPEPVLTAIGDATYYATEVLEAWAETGVFADAARREQAHYEAILEECDSHDPGDRPPHVAAMAEAETREARLGALVGWTLVVEKKASQTSGFFTGQAQPTTASTFRSFGDDYEATREEALDALGTACEDVDDWETATAAASAVVQAAYDDYFETLESLGVKPKPVC